MDLQIIQNKIFEVRGCRGMLDYHLSELYQVETRALKQAVKRNIERFPGDFMFVLTQEEANLLLSIEADLLGQPRFYCCCKYRISSFA